jgi:hypothetical protein
MAIVGLLVTWPLWIALAVAAVVVCVTVQFWPLSLVFVLALCIAGSYKPGQSIT